MSVPVLKAGEVMTEEERKEYMKALVAQTKKYCRIDYEDDEDIIEMMIETILAKLNELIPGFNPYDMTGRQRLLTMIFVKDQYDHTDAYHDTDKKLSNAVSSMLLSEMYGGGVK